MSDNRMVNICRPGHGASCALCCGSHNVRATRGDIGELMSRRAEALREYSRAYIVREMAAGRSPMTGSYYCAPRPYHITLPRLFDKGIQCPFAGFTDGEAAGCLLYPEGGVYGSKRDCFQCYGGKAFLCGAGALRREEIEYAARTAGDWYYYPVLIHEPEYLRAVMAAHPEPEKISREAFAEIGTRLEEFILSDAALHTLDSYFG